MRNCIYLFIIFLFNFNNYTFAEEGFPLRSKFQEVKVLSKANLKKRFDDLTIIDVRSKLEYDIMHIASAKHISISRIDFEQKLASFIKNRSTEIAFYCNGRTCGKSYHAARRAQKIGYSIVYAYDAGIFDWVQAYPNKSVLLGESPVDSNKIISKKDFSSRLIDFDEFKKQIAKKGSIVIDIREPYQYDTRDRLVFKNINVKKYPTDLLKSMLKNSRFRDRQLLLFDNVGKQVRWLQYYLKQQNYNNYRFLKGGIKNNIK